MRFFLFASSFLASMALGAMADTDLAVSATPSRELAPAANMSAAAVTAVCMLCLPGQELLDLEHLESRVPRDQLQCRVECIGHARCNAFNWNSANGGSCYFKRFKEGGPIDYRSNPTNIAAIVQVRKSESCPLVYQRFPNRRFAHAEVVGRVASESDTGCFLHCAGNAACWVTYWTKANGGTCTMMSLWGSGAEEAGAYSGLVRAMQATYI